MNVMHKQIINLFTDPVKTKKSGLWFDGYELNGEFKSWHYNGQLFQHCFYKNGKSDGECKAWHENGKLFIHCFYKNNEKTEDYLK